MSNKETSVRHLQIGGTTGQWAWGNNT